MSTIKILDLSADDRPREKAQRNGIGSLSDAELLAIVLGGGLPGMSVTDMSREMLLSCDNSLLTLSKSGIAELKRRFKGVGAAKATLIAAVFELGRRWRDEVAKTENDKPKKISDSAGAYRMMRSRLEHLPYEEFWVILLTRANTLIDIKCVSRGGISSTVVDSKLIFRHAIDALAAGIILVHNHPSGNLEPSGNDHALTRSIVYGAGMLDIRVLDHLIISAEGFYSFNDNGCMPPPPKL